MPWTAEDFKEKDESLTDDQAERAASIANDVLKQCKKDGALSESKCEVAAIKQALGVVGNMKRINFKINAGKVKRKTVQGREYLVAPVVAVKEGVLNYEDGTEFIPADEIKNSVDFWNGVDLPIGHPEQHGQPISARNKVVVDKNAVGRMWNAHYENEKLKGELWIDVEKAKNMGSSAEEVVNKLENEEPIDVSTAYKREAERKAGEYDGQEYDRVQRNLRPDHLALLPHSTGNMSWGDGVGAPRLNSEGEYMRSNVRSTARTPEYSGTTTGEWSAPDLEDFGYDSVEEMTADEKSEVASHSLLGEAGADTYSNLVFFPVVEPGSGNLNKNALVAVRSGRGQQADIPADAYDSASQKAKQLLKDEFDVEYEENAENIANKVFNKLTNYFRGEEQMSESLETVTENTGFDTEDLEDMEDEKLEVWAEAYNEEPDEGSEGSDDSKGDGEETELKEKVENQAERIEELESKLEAQEQEEREEYVETITANSNWEEDELEDFDLEKLEKLRDNVKPADYSGRGMPNLDDGNDVASDSMEKFINNRGDE